MLAAKHHDHAERLNTLASYDVLDTDGEAYFDDIVTMASRICEAPVSLISLVDNDRQWFKARVGFDPHQTSLEESVCSHAILGDGYLEIPDMTADERTRDNPLTLGDPGARFYAGANLVAPNGLPIGTLCVLDDKPRVLTEFQRDALRTLSQTIMSQLELRRRLMTEKALRDEMDHRVKNSLQTIASILRVASRQISDPDARDLLGLVERRLDAVATLHTELLGKHGTEKVTARTFLNRLAALLTDGAPDNVAVVVESADAEIAPQQASALGMIVSEFTANAIKHSFDAVEGGTVRIMLARDGDELELACSDGGAVSPDDGAIQAVTGLGEAIMQSAAAQIDGEFHHDIGPDGARMTIRFRA